MPKGRGRYRVWTTLRVRVWTTLRVRVNISATTILLCTLIEVYIHINFSERRGLVLNDKGRS